MSEPLKPVPSLEPGLRKKNVRLALILLSVVVAFFLGFVLKVVLFGAPGA